MSDEGVIKIKIKPKMFFTLSFILALITLCGLTFSGLIIWSGANVVPAIWITFVSVLLFGVPAYWMLAIAIKRPVALRMDQNGISGFYADPATWDEIDQINVVTDKRSDQSLGFALCDPIGFRDKQTPWRRFLYWSNGRGQGHHVIIPPVVLEKGQATQLVTTARTFKAKYER